MKKTIKIAPSILAADAARLGEEVVRAEGAGADWLHIDIMDGHFVPNLSFSAHTVKALRPLSGMVFDVHLMVSGPDKYIDDFIDAGADYITVHIEAVSGRDELIRLTDYIHSRGVKTGISVKPSTPVGDIEAVLDLFDLVLVMTVEPGFGGQEYIADMEAKIRWLAEMKEKLYPKLEISADGGINEATAVSAAAAGLTVIVSGTAVFGAEDVHTAIESLREAAERIADNGR